MLRSIRSAFILPALAAISCSSPRLSGEQVGEDPGASTDPGGLSPVVLPGGTSSVSLLPARIRRLTNAEYNRSVQALLGTTQTPGEGFPPDTRQHGYTTNEAQVVDPVLARQLDSAAVSLADEAVTRLDEVAPCADPAAGAEACAQAFIDVFAPRAYRRSITEEERAALLALYQSGATGGTYAEGVHQLIRGILQSPNFLYLTEIGSGEQVANIQLAEHEIASQLAYLLTGGPPDEELLASANAGELGNADKRMEHARRLLATDAGKMRAVQLVQEWLGIDRVSETGKDNTVYPEYDALQSAIEQESIDFIQATLMNGGNVEELLGAPWSIVSPELAAFYGVAGEGRVDLPERIGLLNQAAFLTVHSHAVETGPILRGVALMRRLGCIEIELPTFLNVDIVPPAQDPTKTTRERFSIHSTDQACAACHDLIDPLGFSFEQFNAMGGFQSEDNGKPVDSTVEVALGLDFDGPYSNSNELAAAMALSSEVRTCFARQLFRAQAAERDIPEASEATFIETVNAQPIDQQKALIEILVSFTGQELFSYRTAQ
ncbi:MAG: DUF1592 domain-containing protein [Polyangiaceae bacterium]|nr:DUF1592 domain-containing protein [Polyangiaceae bacterium]